MRHMCLWMLGLLMAAATSAAAFVVTPLSEGQLAVDLTVEADSRAEAIELGKVDAVRGSVGRVFLMDRLILADALLAKYLANYGGNFVSAVEVLEERFQAGRSRLRLRVFVNFAALEKDLDEKRFLYKPAFKPRFATFMTERLEGRITTQGKAREALATALNNLGMRPFPGELTTPPSTTDVAADSFLLDAAIVSSQRAGVEVIVSGESRTRLAEKRKLYFDEYWFYDSEITAALVRVDTGEVLFRAKGSGSASSKVQDEAIELSIVRAAEKAAEQLVPAFDRFWPVVVQRRADYEILFLGVDDELLRIVTQNIERLGRETKVHVRKKFDRSAVLSVEYRGTKQDLLENLTSCPYPTLYILNPEAEAVFEVQVSS